MDEGNVSWLMLLGCQRNIPVKPALRRSFPGFLRWQLTTNVSDPTACSRARVRSGNTIFAQGLIGCQLRDALCVALRVALGGVFFYKRLLERIHVKGHCWRGNAGNGRAKRDSCQDVECFPPTRGTAYRSSGKGECAGQRRAEDEDAKPQKMFP